MSPLRWLVLPLVLLLVACKTGDNNPPPPPAEKPPEPVKRAFVDDINELGTKQLKDKGVVKTECPPMITPQTAEFDCTSDGVALNGPRKVRVHVTNKGKGSYEFTMDTMILDATKLAGQIPKSLDNQVHDPDCGKGVYYANVGEKFMCKAIDNDTSEPVDIEAKVNTKDEILFQIKIKLKPL